jgi:S-adenosylmethionine:tRNA ribosyltransferase-isomerase
VVNRTKVRPARLIGHKTGTGGRVEALLLRRAGDRWEALVRPSRRLRAGVEVSFGSIRGRVCADPIAGVTLLELESDQELETAIEMEGSIPLPPYITRPLPDPARYQTMFAREPGSAAAPTAGLHFTQKVVDRLTRSGIKMAALDLDVGLDTFRPITDATVEQHSIHNESFRLGSECAEAVAAARAVGGKVIAVGTTVVRALETCAGSDRLVRPAAANTDLFITPGYQFKVVDALVTNFHMPRTTLLVLVAAFMGEAWRKAYEAALERRYRFLSFGDAMYAEGRR